MNQDVGDSNLRLVTKLVIDSIAKKAIDDEKIEKVGCLPGDASTRSYYRIKTNQSKYVVCLETTKNEFDARSNFIIVNEAFSANQVRVPRIYDTVDKDGYILQEDLGDETLLMRFSKLSSIDEEYVLLKDAIDKMIAIHSINTNNYKNANFAKLKFDKEKLLAEVEFSITHFFKSFLDHDLTSLEESRIRKDFERICSELGSTKHVLCHRDYHSRNIMVTNDELVLIDFQDARMGIPQYDLVSILEDCYYKVNGYNVEKLKKYYWDNFLSKQKIQKSFDEFEYYYNLMAIQRIFKAVGSFSFFVSKKSDYRYLKYIGYAMEKLKEFMYKDTSLDELRKIIYGHYYEN